MHKLLGDHKWKAHGFDYVCECGAVKKNANTCKVFNDGDIIGAKDINSNFQALIDTTKDQEQQIIVLKDDSARLKSEVNYLKAKLKEVEDGR